MKETVLVVCCALSLLGCKEHSKDTTVAPVAKRDASSTTNRQAAPNATRYKACWASYNAAKWDELRACYAPGASIDPGLDGKQLFDVAAKIDADKKLRMSAPKSRADVELVIVADTTIIGIVHTTGTAPSYLADVVEYDDHGLIKSEEIYRDAQGVSRPLPAGLVESGAVVTATGTDAERSNEDVVDQFVSSVGRRAKPFDQWLSPDVVWSARWLANDLSHETFGKLVNQLRAGIDGFEYGSGTSWFAGDFVVRRAREEGRPADMPWLGIPGDPHTHVEIPALTIFRLDHGRIKVAADFWTLGALYVQLGIQPPAVAPSFPPASR